MKEQGVIEGGEMRRVLCLLGWHFKVSHCDDEMCLQSFCRYCTKQFQIKWWK